MKRFIFKTECKRESSIGYLDLIVLYLFVTYEEKENIFFYNVHVLLPVYVFTISLNNPSTFFYVLGTCNSLYPYGTQTYRISSKLSLFSFYGVCKHRVHCITKIKTSISTFGFYLDYLDLVEYLIEQQCDVNKTDINNVSALHIACQRGYLDAVKLLMKGKHLKSNSLLL